MLIIPLILTAGFSVDKITSKYPTQNEWKVDGDEEFAKEILGQTFTYLGSGNHTYVFASEDGEYVLKFFKQKHMRIQSLFPQAKEKRARRKKERKNSFKSYKIAYETLPELTGTLYLHLTKSSHLQKNITIIDQHGKAHKLPADEMEFLIQRKAQVGFAHVQDLLEKKQKDKALNALCSYLSLIKKRAEKGIRDSDRQLYKNYGFIQGKPTQLDIGNFTFDPKAATPDNIKKEIEEVSAQVLDFISTYAPELTHEIKKRIEKL